MTRWLRRSVPIVLQAETNECGLCCVAMLLAAHGKHLSMRELRAEVSHSRQLSLKELTELLSGYNLLPRCLRCEPTDLKELGLPAILHVDMNHYVVLVKVHRRGVTLVDPGQGKIRVSWEKLNRRFTGIVIEADPDPEIQPEGKQRQFSVWPLIRHLPARELRLGLAGILLLSLLIQGFALTTPFYLQIMIDEVLMVGNLEMATVVVVGFLMIYLMSAMTQLLRGLLVVVVGSRIAFMLSAGMMSHITKIDLPYFRSRTVGDIASRFSSLQPVQQFLSESVVRISIDLLTVATTSIVLFCISAEIALLVLASTVVFLFIQYCLLQPYREHQHEYLVCDANLQTHFIDTIQTMDTTRRYEATDPQLQDWLNQLTQSLNASLRARNWALVSEISRYLLVGILTVLVVALAARDVSSSAITLGMLYTLAAYASHLTGALVSLTAEWQGYMMLSLHAQRLSDLTDAEKDERITVRTESYLQSFECRDISCRDLQQLILFRVSFRMSRHQSVAIVGPSGCGKSTLLAVLRGESTPETGEIRVNGHLLHENQDPTRLFASLLPTDRIIRGSVLDNITYLDPTPNQQRMMKAASLSGIHESIMQFPLAYLERLSEENCIMSTGQRQRLLLARVLYRRADILILDEATSHLDEESEIAVMSRVLSLPRMCIFVTHRQRVAQLADQVIQLESSRAFPDSDRVSGNTSANQSTAMANPIAR